MFSVFPAYCVVAEDVYHCGALNDSNCTTHHFEHNNCTGSPARPYLPYS